MSEKVTEQPIDAASIENVNGASKEAAGVEAIGRAAKIKQLANMEGNSLKTVVICKIDVDDKAAKGSGELYKNAIIRLNSGANVPVSMATANGGHTTEISDTLMMPLSVFLQPFQRVTKYAIVINKIEEIANIGGDITRFFIGLKVDVLSQFVKAGVAYSDPLRRNGSADIVNYDRYFNSIVMVHNETNEVVNEALAFANKLVWEDIVNGLKAHKEAVAAAAKSAAAVTAISTSDAAF